MNAGKWPARVGQPKGEEYVAFTEKHPSRATFQSSKESDSREESPFKRLFQNFVNDGTTAAKMTTPELAKRLGVKYRRFMYWHKGERDFPAELLPRICLELEDYELLDVLEREAGRVSYQMPEISKLPNIEDVRAIQRLYIRA
jgi:hypothetical protein